MTTSGPAGEPGAAASRRSAVALACRAVQVRLRFVAVLVTAWLVVGHWDTIASRVEAVGRRFPGTTGAVLDRQQPVSTDTEYFCPMDPGVRSDWPGPCGVCNMGLVRRKRWEATPRPDGVLARMQFSPYRVELAGLRTAPADYRELFVEARGVGRVAARDGSRATLLASFFERDRSALVTGLEVLVEPAPPRAGVAPRSGQLQAFEADGSCRITVEDPSSSLHPGDGVVVRFRRSVADLEPFRSQPVNPPALRPADLRTLHVCPDHPDQPRAGPGRCPLDGNPLESFPLEPNQRVRWTCPTHRGVSADTSDAACSECDRAGLTPRVVTYRPTGLVLAVPESCVIDTGARTVVYREHMPGTFDAVEVSLGPRCGGYYPVASGLEPGDRVATSGAFLVDAETRIDPALAASYFGAAGRSPAATVGPSPPLNAPDQLLADRQQGVCPVTHKLLGSMGAPVRVEVAGRSVLICCEGCEARLRKEPDRYLKPSPPPRQ